MAAKPTLASIPLEARALVLDHLKFNDVLKATTTDRAGREALRSIKRAYGIKEAILLPNMLSKLARCESIDIMARSAVVMERLAWVLIQLRHLRGIKVVFPPNADMSSWNRSCDALARSMDDVSRIDFFRVKQGIKTLTPILLSSESFRSVLLKLPSDCALDTALHGRVPYDVVNSLLTRGANPNRVSRNHLETFGGKALSMLSKACKLQSVSVIRLLLQNGARLRQPEDFDSFHWTILRDNAAADHIDIFRILYDAGLLSWTERTSGGGLLHYFVSALIGTSTHHLTTEQFLPLVRLVLERQPDLAISSDSWGRTPLTLLIQLAPTRGFSKETILLAKVLAEAERAGRMQTGRSNDS